MKTGVSVADAMTRRPISVEANTTMKRCAEVMAGNRVGSLIIKEGDRLMGIIKERDIVRSVVLNNVDSSKAMVKDYMIVDAVTINPNVDIYDALVKMRDMDVRMLPVVDNGKVVGLLTVKDILKVQPSLFDLLAEKLVLREEEGKPIFRKRDI